MSGILDAIPLTRFQGGPSPALEETTRHAGIRAQEISSKFRDVSELLGSKGKNTR